MGIIQAVITPVIQCSANRKRSMTSSITVPLHLIWPFVEPAHSPGRSAFPQHPVQLLTPACPANGPDWLHQCPDSRPIPPAPEESPGPGFEGDQAAGLMDRGKSLPSAPGTATHLAPRTTRGSCLAGTVEVMTAVRNSGHWMTDIRRDGNGEDSPDGRLGPTWRDSAGDVAAAERSAVQPGTW